MSRESATSRICSVTASRNTPEFAAASRRSLALAFRGCRATCAWCLKVKAKRRAHPAVKNHIGGNYSEKGDTPVARRTASIVKIWCSLSFKHPGSFVSKQCVLPGV